MNINLPKSMIPLFLTYTEISCIFGVSQTLSEYLVLFLDLGQINFYMTEKPQNNSDLNRSVYFSHLTVWRASPRVCLGPWHCKGVRDSAHFISLLRYFQDMAFVVRFHDGYQSPGHCIPLKRKKKERKKQSKAQTLSKKCHRLQPVCNWLECHMAICSCKGGWGCSPQPSPLLPRIDLECYY